MAWLFKAAGLTVLFCACSAYGVLKSYSLKKRKKALTEKQCAEAEKNCAELCRLYTAFGVLCGAFLCIFFL